MDIWKHMANTFKKGSGYRMEILDNKPKLIKRSFIGGLTRRFKSLFKRCISLLISINIYSIFLIKFMIFIKIV